MAADYLLEIKKIPGESQDKKHPNTIEVTSWSWGVSNPGSMGVGGGGGTGKSTLQDLHFTSHMGKASTLLAQFCATGEHITDEVTLYVRKAGKEAQEYLVIKLNDIIISSYHTGGSGGGGAPVDQFSINFAKIRIEYKPQKADGTLGAVVPMEFDVKAGVATS